MSSSLPIRKPPFSETTRRRAGVPLASVRREMWTQACELVSAGDKRDVAVVLANVLSMVRQAEAAIEEVIFEVAS